MIIYIAHLAGPFGENKDIARSIREQKIRPALLARKQVTLDFIGMNGATQSFVHALLSELIREFGPDIFDSLTFKNCSDVVREVILTVSDYMQEV